MPTGHERILAVDDDPHVLRVVTNILRSAGYEVETAVDGAEALEAVARTRPDLILLDALMPVKDGFAVLEELRADPAAPPVVGLTAISDHEAFARFLTSGASAYVCKPVSMHQLLHVVRITLDGRRRSEAHAEGAAHQEPRREQMVGVRTLGVSGAPTMLGELKEITPELARVILIAPLEVGSRVRVILHVSIAGGPVGFEAVVNWCAAGPQGFAHGLGELRASKEAWDCLLSTFGAETG
jgi:DNA-binding response OmpR family regulator